MHLWISELNELTCFYCDWLIIIIKKVTSFQGCVLLNFSWKYSSCANVRFLDHCQRVFQSIGTQVLVTTCTEQDSYLILSFIFPSLLHFKNLPSQLHDWTLSAFKPCLLSCGQHMFVQKHAACCVCGLFRFNSRTGKGKGVGGGTKRCDSVKVHLTLFPLGDVLDSKSNLTHLVLWSFFPVFSFSFWVNLEWKHYLSYTYLLSPFTTHIYCQSAQNALLWKCITFVYPGRFLVRCQFHRACGCQ